MIMPRQNRMIFMTNMTELQQKQEGYDV